MTIQSKIWQDIGVPSRIRQPDIMALVARAYPDRNSDELVEQAVVVTQAKDGCPVIAVSERFERHTGYSWDEVVGQSLSILQGEGTDEEAVNHFRTLIAAGRAGRIRILNYRKDGTPFWNICDFRPVRDAAGVATHFVTVQYAQVY